MTDRAALSIFYSRIGIAHYARRSAEAKAGRRACASRIEQDHPDLEKKLAAKWAKAAEAHSGFAKEKELIAHLAVPVELNKKDTSLLRLEAANPVTKTEKSADTTTAKRSQRTAVRGLLKKVNEILHKRIF